MAAQEFAALAIVALTAGIFVWRLLRPRRFHSKKHSACGCSGSSSAAPQERIIFKAKKGEIPQILIMSK